MIDERELLDTINQLLEEPVSITDCSKIASLMIVHDHLYGEVPRGRDSRESIEIIRTDQSSVFLKAANNKEATMVMAIMDELMDAVKILQPRIYDEVIARLKR